ncbi:MAG: mechanosensitive ion channel domain-containing protein [Acidobacteriota bacterium]
MLETVDLQQLTQEYLVPYSIALVQAILIFVIGRFVAGLVVRLISKLLERSKLDEMLIDFITSILKALLLLVVIVAALNELGVDTTSLVALIGAAGLAIGLALQGSLQNFSAGSLLVFFRPIKVGEFVEVAGVSGVVEEIQIFQTQLRTGDNKLVIVPNSQIYGSVITNYSRKPTRRVDMVFGIGYEDDIDRAREVMQGILDADERILDDPAPTIAVSELADSSVNFVVRPWVGTDDYWAVLFDTTEAVKKAFDAEGISIPYPQMDVHLDGAVAGGDASGGQPN